MNLVAICEFTLKSEQEVAIAAPFENLARQLKQSVESIVPLPF